MSILNQTHVDFEVIIVDDDQQMAPLIWRASSRNLTTGFMSTVRQPISVWSRIGTDAWNWRAVSGSNSFSRTTILHLNCLSRVLEMARGSERPLVFCEREILIEPGTEAWLVDFFEGGLVRFGEIFPTESVVSAADLRRRFLGTLGMNFLGEPTSTLFHRSCVTRHGGSNRQLVQLCDLEYWYRVGCHEGVALIRDKLATLRVHGASATTGELCNASKVIPPRTRYRDPLRRPFDRSLIRTAARRIRRCS
jgi:hypothetical protein